MVGSTGSSTRDVKPDRFLSYLHLWYSVYVVRLHRGLFHLARRPEKRAPRIRAGGAHAGRGEKKHKDPFRDATTRCARSLVRERQRRGKLLQRGISVTAATRRRMDVWKTIIRNARCANPYNVQSRIYFRAFGSSSPPRSSPALNGSPWNSVK